MIKFLDLHKINARYHDAFQLKFQEFLNSGHYILGQGVTNFETEFASFCGTKHCIGVGTGLDAITLIFKSYIALGRLNEGDEVLVPANTFIASILAIIQAGLKPVFVEPDIQTYNIAVSELEQNISSKTKAVLVVHLYGQLADMNAIQKLATKNNLLVVEDAAQAQGAVYSDGRKSGNLGDAGAFSFYPSKNLGALGDGGAVTTNDADLAEMLMKLRNYGTSSKYVNDYLGYNSRLDDIQARFLSVKLAHLDADNAHRQKIANRYLSEVKNPKIILPLCADWKSHVFHLFVIRVDHRERFISFTKKHNIEILIHYPIPPYKQKALSHYSALQLPVTDRIHNTVVSLPISPVMEDQEVDYVINVLNGF
ncbi:DegT/DnrJ/EryC1/StrS family aminotransferase [Formosa sp. 4Alg 33]|uniref:DegT/DnrJ/EryC1/StrS family aminotransferase n=1 Tax=Formosa sp. 4Alg 33 TaxID=3382189 RepID=UPI003D9C071D